MDGLVLDHFKWLMIILYSDMPAMDVGVELLRLKHTERHSNSMFA